MKRLFIYGVICAGFIGISLFATTESALAETWSTPPRLANIKCKNGHLATGNCRAKWDDISNGLVNQLTNCTIQDLNGGRCKLPGKFY